MNNSRINQYSFSEYTSIPYIQRFGVKINPLKINNNINNTNNNDDNRTIIRKNNSSQSNQQYPSNYFNLNYTQYHNQ